MSSFLGAPNLLDLDRRFQAGLSLEEHEGVAGLGTCRTRAEIVRILIADDDDGFRVFMRRVLEREKELTVIGEAMDGEEAVRKSQRLRPDLLLIDMDLPRVDGLEATRQVKASLPATWVIMFSSLDGPAYREAAARCGADEFLPKLAPLSKIVGTIRKSPGTKAA